MHDCLTNEEAVTKIRNFEAEARAFGLIGENARRRTIGPSSRRSSERGEISSKNPPVISANPSQETKSPVTTDTALRDRCCREMLVYAYLVAFRADFCARSPVSEVVRFKQGDPDALYDDARSTSRPARTRRRRGGDIHRRRRDHVPKKWSKSVGCRARA